MKTYKCIHCKREYPGAAMFGPTICRKCIDLVPDFEDGALDEDEMNEYYYD